MTNNRIIEPLPAPTIIKKVLVGSRLHGLHNEQSDYDYRGIHMTPLRYHISPFRTLKTTDWIEGDIDNTSYELNRFCFDATKGNATTLEVFFSDVVIDNTSIGRIMRSNWKKFIDTDQFIKASRGYASNQYTKMALYDDIGIKGQRRTGKFIIAYLRVLWQCTEFLRTNEFRCVIPDGDMRDFMLLVKNNKWSDTYIPAASAYMATAQEQLALAQRDYVKLTPDYAWIEDFLWEAYSGNV